MIPLAAVYMSRHRHLWKDHEVFTASLASTSEEVLPPKTEYDSSEAKQQQYGPGSLGCTYELCAGIVDKRKSLEQITLDEILEETGKITTALAVTLLCLVKLNGKRRKL